MVSVTSAAETSVLLTSRGKTTKLSVLVNRVADPVDSWVIPDSIVCCVNENDFKVLVGGIL